MDRDNLDSTAQDVIAIFHLTFAHNLETTLPNIFLRNKLRFVFRSAAPSSRNHTSDYLASYLRITDTVPMTYAISTREYLDITWPHATATPARHDRVCIHFKVKPPPNQHSYRPDLICMNAVGAGRPQAHVRLDSNAKTRMRQMKQ